MKSKSVTARPVGRKAQSEARVKKTVAPQRKSQPIIQTVERREISRESPQLTKKEGVLPTPFASFTF